jgi:hypothetical protein
LTGGQNIFVHQIKVKPRLPKGYLYESEGDNKSIEKRSTCFDKCFISEDMGYEFNAIVPDGVIYAEPSMLLNYSDDK